MENIILQRRLNNISEKNTKYKIIYEKDARRELENIYLYIKNRLNEEKIAKKVILNIMDKIRNLEYFPFAYNIINERNQYRKFVVKNYIIIYNVNLESKIIEILHIYNEKQYK